MPTIALKLASAIMLLGTSCACWASENPPHILREPLLGLRYDSRIVKFDPLPPALLQPCSTLAADEHIRPNWVIFGYASDQNGTYYIAGGYSVRTLPHAAELPTYELDGPGVIFNIKDGRCVVFEEAARQMFEPNLAGEIPAPVLLALAHDHAERLERAFGGVRKVQRAAREQHIDAGKLPPTLRQVYTPLLKGATR